MHSTVCRKWTSHCHWKTAVSFFFHPLRTECSKRILSECWMLSLWDLSLKIVPLKEMQWMQSNILYQHTTQCFSFCVTLKTGFLNYFPFQLGFILNSFLLMDDTMTCSVVSVASLLIMLQCPDQAMQFLFFFSFLKWMKWNYTVDRDLSNLHYAYMEPAISVLTANVSSWRLVLSDLQIKLQNASFVHTL